MFHLIKCIIEDKPSGFKKVYNADSGSGAGTYMLSLSVLSSFPANDYGRKSKFMGIKFEIVQLLRTC